MCIITRKSNNVVVEISLIPGLDTAIAADHHIYFPYKGELPDIGDVFIPEYKDGMYSAPKKD